ncbi:MAG TPA: hypothetical protein VHB79_22995 [Polyangiaceae bacterium]|nr:hypothetical protein [Polyangiaceae bacterium]
MVTNACVTGSRLVPWLLLGALAVAALGCEPTFDDRNSEVLARRVLAIRATPAQVKPSAPVKLSALVVEPSGTLKKFAVDWAFCKAPKPVAETNDVSALCLEYSGEQFDELGKRSSVTGTMPEDACRLFGPDVPPSMADEPAGRPTDPDSTGSYYQPLRVLADSEPQPVLALGQVGLICGLPVLTGEQLFAYQKRVRVNEHPAISNVLIDGDDAKPLSVDDGETKPVSVKAGEQLKLRLTWPDCPSEDQCGDGICGMDETAMDCAEDCMTPKGCAGAETYVYYDPLARKLVDRREALRVSWFSGSGSFGDDHTGRREDETDTFSDGVWTAPSTPGLTHLWVVLRDSRGGVDWQSYVVNVE